VACRNLVPDPSVHYSFIDVDNSYCSNSGPMPPSSRPCAAPDNYCWGSQYTLAPAYQKNGRCDSDGNTCTCRSPWFGSQCTLTDQIANVATNGAVFGAAGVPKGQPLLITWTSSTSATRRVDVLVTKAGSNPWPAPQYLAVGIQNTNAFSWVVGDILKNGLEPGSDYKVLVWASRTNYAWGAASFAIADPCAYMSCGIYGQCNKGFCECNGGYSGPTCAIGPCEAAQCDSQYSSCNNTRVISNGQYLTANVCKLDAASSTCLQGYTGAQCRTPPLCAAAGLVCYNGGDLAGVVTTDTSCSGTCSCVGLWNGPTCSQCGLTCEHGGVPKDDCSACANCKPGYFGQSCECKYYVLAFRFNVDVSSWFVEQKNGTAPNPEAELARERWSKTLSLDLLDAVSTVSAQRAAVSVDVIRPIPASAANGGQAQVYVEVHLSLDCGSVAAMGGGEDAPSAKWVYSSYQPLRGPSAAELALIHHSTYALPSANSVDVVADLFSGANRRLLQEVVPSGSNVTGLFATYNAFLPLLSDNSSSVYQGQITSQADSSWTVTASDPSGENVLEAPKPPRDCFQQDCSVPADSSNGGGGGSSSGIVDTIMSSTLYSALFLAGCALVLAAIILLVVFAVRRHRQSASTSTNLDKLANSEMANITTNPALERNIHQTGRWSQI
jgi:hypothetical protein